MKDNCILLGILVWLSALTIAICEMKEKPPEVQEVIILHEEYDDIFKDKEANSVTMQIACEYFGIKYPRIVTAQAILESGNFKSKVFQKYNRYTLFHQYRQFYRAMFFLRSARPVQGRVFHFL